MTASAGEHDEHSNSHKAYRPIGLQQTWLRRRDLTEVDWKSEGISRSFYTAPLGTFYALSHGFWFATPARLVWRNVFIKTAAAGALGAAFQASTVLAANLRKENDSLNQAFGGFIAGNLAGLARSGVQHGLFYGLILSWTAALCTEAGSSHYERMSKPFDSERRLAGFLAVPNDPFEKRIQEQRDLKAK